MAANPQPRLMSPEAYLAFERAADRRHEYIDGEIVAMSGGTARHAILINEFARALGNALDARPCIVSSSELRLQVAPKDAYFYPDIMVTCGPMQFAGDHKDMITNPIVIVEVLSEYTERWDRSGKFAQYRRVESLREYVLVSQNELLIEWFTRRENGDWIYRDATGPEAICHLESLDLKLSLAAIYRKLDLLG